MMTAALELGSLSPSGNARGPATVLSMGRENHGEVAHHNFMEKSQSAAKFNLQLNDILPHG